YADKIGAKYSMIIGDDEINNGKAILKNMETKEEREVHLDELVTTMKSIL
ncbi:MAG TPA: His/Gly/Thr/Pro-type tRNA ligase C-terminal domain-containing protein, partial [Defluviitaleaceae bacterium]|nr:His/Gly/Thr/Pro-type tRNA ligase C-terminal domain-containing protein [Defluviitaleaceae bacterium]